MKNNKKKKNNFIAGMEGEIIVPQQQQHPDSGIHQH